MEKPSRQAQPSNRVSTYGQGSIPESLNPYACAATHQHLVKPSRFPKIAAYLGEEQDVKVLCGP